jgi:hypothetical protein
MLFFVQAGCGTILYPERRGQKAPPLDRFERVDPIVVMLDGLLLFVFLVPGLVAFGVDFATGAIYLPPGKTNLLKPKSGAIWNDVQVVRIDPDELSMDTIKHVVQAHTGRTIQFDGPDLLLFKPDDNNIDIQQELSKLNMGIVDTSKGAWFKGSEVNFITDSSGRLVRIEVPLPTNTRWALVK